MRTCIGRMRGCPHPLQMPPGSCCIVHAPTQSCAQAAAHLQARVTKIVNELQWDVLPQVLCASGGGLVQCHGRDREAVWGFRSAKGDNATFHGHGIGLQCLRPPDSSQPAYGYETVSRAFECTPVLMRKVLASFCSPCKVDVCSCTYACSHR